MVNNSFSSHNLLMMGKQIGPNVGQLAYIKVYQVAILLQSYKSEKITMQSQKNNKATTQTDLILISQLFTTQKAAELIKTATSLNYNRIYLYHNYHPTIIKEISHIDFPFLTLIHLSYNNLCSIQYLPHLNSPNLKVLHLSFNNIRKLKPLRKCYFPLLEKLSIMGNKIKEFDSFCQFDFPVLETVYLEDVKNNGDRRDQNPAVFAKCKTRRLTNFTTLSKSLPHVRAMIKY